MHQKILRGQQYACVTVLQEKDRLKKEKDEAEVKYKYALVDGRKEQVGTHAGSFYGVLRRCCVSAQLFPR